MRQVRVGDRLIDKTGLEVVVVRELLFSIKVYHYQKDALIDFTEQDMQGYSFI